MRYIILSLFLCTSLFAASMTNVPPVASPPRDIRTCTSVPMHPGPQS